MHTDAPSESRSPFREWLIRHSTKLVCLFLAAGTILAYWQVSSHEFINYDDPDYVTQNHYVKGGLSKEGLGWAFGSIHGASTYWHPLTWVSHMLDCQLFGLDAGWHHSMNLVFHVLNVLLLFELLNRMTRAPWRSAFVAALFALHPIQVGSVAWIAERKNVLSTFFWIVTLLAYVKYAERQKLRWYGAMVISFALGLMSKPMLVTLPCVILVLDFWPLRRFQFTAPAANADSPQPGFRTSSLSRLLGEKIPLLALSVVSCLLTVLAHQGLGMIQEAEKFGWGVRLETVVVAYARYIKMILWPSGFSILYPHPGSWPKGEIIGGTLALAAITGVVIWQARRKPYFLMGWLWFLGVLVPVIGLVQVGEQAMADRFVYVPSIGLFLMLTWGVSELLIHQRHGKAALGVLSAFVLIGCLARTWVEVGYWHDSISVFRRAIEVTSNNAIANNNLGSALDAQGNIEKSIACYREALRINPHYSVANNNLGFALAQQGKDSEALPYYKEALRTGPNNSAAHFNLGVLLYKFGKWDEAASHFQTGLRRVPKDALAHKVFGDVLSAQRKWDEAIAHYKESIRLQDSNAEARFMLAATLVEKGQTDEAMLLFAQILNLPVAPARAYAQAGVNLTSAQRPIAAITCYQEALRHDPDAPDVLNNLAWLLATVSDAQARDGVKAVELSKRACALTAYERPVFIGTLAAAYAEAGLFKEALQAAGKARTLALSLGEKDVVAANEKLILLFQENKPFHESR